MRYVVTGAAGFIGSHLAEALQDAGHDVLGIDCLTDHYDPALKEENAERLEVARLDLAEAPLDAPVAGADGVFHFAAQPGVRESWGEEFAVYVRRNVVASQRLFEAAARAGVRVVFASSSSVYGEAEAYPTPEDASPRPISPYGITKLACEHLARAHARSFGLDAVTLRLFSVYGPRQRPDMAFARVVAALAEGRAFPLYGDGSQTRDFTYVADAVAAALAAMDAGRAGAVYNVGGGSEAALRDAIAVLEREAGRTLELDRRPAAAGDVTRTKADTSRARAELGWSPRVGLAEGLKAQWSWSARASGPLAVRGRRGQCT